MDALTREPPNCRPAHAPRRWPMLLACLAVLAAIGAMIWLWHPGGSHKGEHAAAPSQAVPIVDAAGHAEERADLPRRAGHRAGIQHRHHQADGRWPADLGEFQGRPGGPQGRRAGADRSAPLPGGAGPGAGEEGRRRGAAGQREDSIMRATRSWWRTNTPRRSRPTPPRRRWRSTRRRCSRTTRDRNRAHQPELHHDHRADRRAHRHPPGGCRQYRASVGCHRPGGDHPAASDLRACSPCRSSRWPR